MTIKDIAAIADVSVGTVSNVLNDKSHVAPELRTRVLSAIENTNYRVNLHARGMILKRSFNIGVVIPSLADPFFPNFAEAIETLLEDWGSDVIITSSRNSAARERERIEALIAKQIDGLIVTPCSQENSEWLNSQIGQSVPMVQLGRYFEEIECPIVRAGNREVGEKALLLLTEANHTRIVHVSGDLSALPDRERYLGFLSEADRRGVSAGIEVLSPDAEAGLTAYETLTRRLKAAPRFTAIFADNDAIALECLKACFENGVRVPEDVSIVSVGGFYPNRMLPKNLNTFVIDAIEMSRLAIDFLYSQLSTRDSTNADRQREITTVPLTYREGDTLAMCPLV